MEYHEAMVSSVDCGAYSVGAIRMEASEFCGFVGRLTKDVNSVRFLASGLPVSKTGTSIHLAVKEAMSNEKENIITKE